MSRRYLSSPESAARAQHDLDKMQIELAAFEAEGDDQKENAEQVRLEMEALQDELDLYLEDGGDDMRHYPIKTWI
ncbi:MAG: hypothetical protein KGJ13_12265 [Patescibacteria group bacterium]|nr:hypothetical protein [Patescibacteria group bacterium]